MTYTSFVSLSPYFVRGLSSAAGRARRGMKRAGRGATASSEKIFLSGRPAEIIWRGKLHGGRSRRWFGERVYLQKPAERGERDRNESCLRRGTEAFVGASLRLISRRCRRTASVASTPARFHGKATSWAARTLLYLARSGKVLWSVRSAILRSHNARRSHVSPIITATTHRERRHFSGRARARRNRGSPSKRTGDPLLSEPAGGLTTRPTRRRLSPTWVAPPTHSRRERRLGPAITADGRAGLEV